MKLRLMSILLGSLVIAACDTSSDSRNAPLNLAPTISSIGDQSVTANAPSDPIAFSVTDERPDDLVISLQSDNTGLVPVDGIAVGGSATDRTLTITPVEDRTGDSLVTVLVTDAAGLTASAAFMLTVAAEEKSLLQFTLSSFATPADGDPELVNAVEFERDAEAEDFDELLNP